MFAPTFCVCTHLHLHFLCVHICTFILCVCSNSNDKLLATSETVYIRHQKLMVLLFKRLYKIKAKKHDFWVIKSEIVIFHDTYTCILYTHAYIYFCNDWRSCNKTLNDLSRTDKNSRNFCRYIKLSICIINTCISVLSVLGTQDELFHGRCGVTARKGSCSSQGCLLLPFALPMTHSLETT